MPPVKSSIITESCPSASRLNVHTSHSAEPGTESPDNPLNHAPWLRISRASFVNGRLYLPSKDEDANYSGCKPVGFNELFNSSYAPASWFQTARFSCMAARVCGNIAFFEECPPGRFCFSQLIRIVREKQASDATAIAWQCALQQSVEFSSRIRSTTCECSFHRSITGIWFSN